LMMVVVVGFLLYSSFVVGHET